MPLSEPAAGYAEPTTWAEANLALREAAGLIALSDGLCQIACLRDGRDAGQFSIFNFLLRAAYEDPPMGSTDQPLVILMQAGVFRRHAWYMRLHWPHGGQAFRLELASPIDRGWLWWPDIQEIAKRLDGKDVWRQTVRKSWQTRSAEIAADLQAAELYKIRR